MTIPPKRRTVPSVWDVALGALLHDIGKLAQRAGETLPAHILKRQTDVLPAHKGCQSHWHALWSDTFFDWTEQQDLDWPEGVDPHWVRDLAVFHHNPLQVYGDNPLLAATELVTLADRAASGYERKARDEEIEAELGADSTGSTRHKYRRIPQAAITCAISFGGASGQKGWYRPSVFSAQTLMPEDSISGQDVENAYPCLWQDFKAGWKEVVARAGDNPHAFEEGVLSLMERTCWAVPSSTMDQPDVSLHDHSRAVAAFAAALYHYHKAHGELSDASAIKDREAPKLRFLVGDLSGIQNTLFRLKSEQVKGLNRILRGRSLRFQLIAEMAVRRALQTFDLPMASALQTAGGRFLLLVPVMKDGEEERLTDELRVDIDDWMAEQYCGDLGIGLALSEPFAVMDLCPKNVEEKREVAMQRAVGLQSRLQVAIETAKLRQMQAPAARAVFDVRYPDGVCAACGVRPAQGQDGRCMACDAEHAHGRAFPKARAVILRLPEKGAAQALGDAIFGGRSILPTDDRDRAETGDLGWRFKEADPGPAAIKENRAYVPLFKASTLETYRNVLEDHNDIEAGGIKTFAALAHDSRELVDGRRHGREMLAVLKADVDNLGLIFTRGLGSTEEWSLARASALSRMMDGYFTVRLPWLLDQNFKNIYTVYAGGDDLFLVGPWRDIFDFARELHRDFSAFSLNNEAVTISAGIALFTPRTPISIPAREAEQRLEAAKDAGKNRIAAVDKGPMLWEEFDTALDDAKKLNGWLRDGSLSTAGLYRFLSFDDARQRLADGKIKPADYTWRGRFGYHLARLLPKRENDPVQQEISTTLTHLFALDAELSEQDRRPGARLAITHALYRNR